MPRPINSPRTRVVDTGANYVMQFSTDGLIWFNLPDLKMIKRWVNSTEELTNHDYRYVASRITLAADEPAAVGKVVSVY